MAEPILSVRDLKTYFRPDEGIVRAVDGASFDLYPGRTLGIVGESGCGKSVTARSILRIVDRPGKVEGGAMLLRRGDGRVVDLASIDESSSEMRDIRGGEIGYVFQEPMSSLSVFYTIGNQVIEAIRLHRKISKKEAKDRAIELLQLVGIPRPEQRVNSYSFELSGGLRQRVMIALALAAEPRILIADEPTTALDVTTQAQILELIRKIQIERDLAVVLITHDMGVIAEMADTVSVMYLGKVVEIRLRGHDLPCAQASLYAGSPAFDPVGACGATFAPGDHRRKHSAPVRAAAGLPVPSALPIRNSRNLRQNPPPATALDAEHEVRCFLCSEPAGSSA